MSTLTNINNFKGGLNLQEATTLGDNQFEVLTNMFYTRDQRLQSRRWFKTFGNPVPSPNTNKPITSYFFFQNDTTLDRTALIVAGDTLYEYSEWTGNWTARKTGLTEFEADWVTRTRFDFAVFKNIVYLCNWIDNYASYDPATTTYTEYAGQPKVRYIEFVSDVLAWSWEDLNPSTVYWTDNVATVADASIIDANFTVAWWDEEWRVNGLAEYWANVLAMKNNKIYNIDIVNGTAVPIDPENGWYWNRSIKRVSNNLFYFNDRWIERLIRRNGTTWAASIESQAVSDDVRASIWSVLPKNYNLTHSQYILPLTNYYTSYDASNSGKPDTTLVYSSLTQGWSKYTYPASFDYWRYITNEWTEIFLLASANAGQMYQIETWFNDLWFPIPCELRTKRWDFWDITKAKTFETVDIVWLKSQWDIINIDIVVDWDIISWWEIDDTNTNQNNTILTVWTEAIGTNPIWWDVLGWNSQESADIPWASVDLYQYKIRIPMYAVWSDIQVRMTSSSTNLVWTLDKISIRKDKQDFDFFPYEFIW